MVRLFDGEVDVSYYQFYLETPEVIPGDDVERRFAGQTNGLCGAGEPGMLQFTTGLHTGLVPVTVDLLDTAPSDVAVGWEEVVEVSLTTSTPTVLLYDWDQQQPVELPLGHGTFRVRYHAHHMQAGSDADVRQPDEPVLDRYLLQIWPAPPTSDTVLRRTSDLAAYWHDTARNTPTPSIHHAGSKADEAAGHENDGLAAFQRFLDDITAISPTRQRAAARWLAHHAADTAGPETAAWLRPALDALDADQPLPAPFDDHQRALAAMHQDLAHLEGPRDTSNNDDGPRAPRPSTSALVTVRRAADPNPTRAVLSALATANVDRRPDAEFHGELRHRFLT